MPKTIQSGAKTNRKSFQNFSYWLGGIDVTDQNLDRFTPYIQGVSRIFMYKAPPYMDQQYPDLTFNFKTFIEAGYTSVGGIGNLGVEFTEFQGGFAGQQFQNVQLVRDETDTLTMQVYELSGSPVREYLDTWVSGVRDPRSGVAHYHGAIEQNLLDAASGKGYSEQNHTCEFVYITMDPTALVMEYSCLFAHCFPKSVPKDHLNYERGNRENKLMDLEFSTTKYESPAINDVGQWYLAASRVEYNYLNFNPNITQDMVNTAAINYGNSSGNG